MRFSLLVIYLMLGFTYNGMAMHYSRFGNIEDTILNDKSCKNEVADEAAFDSKKKVISLQKKRAITTQIKTPNVVYLIQYDFDLNKDTLNVPEHCVLRFDGGSLYNGTVIFNSTLLEGDFRFDESVFLDGTIKNSFLTSSNVGCKGDGVHDDAPNLRNAIRLIKNSNRGELHLDEGTFLLNSGDENSISWLIKGFSVFQMPDNFTLSGEGDKSKLLYNPNRLTKHSSGNIYCGCLFSNERGGCYYKVKGTILLRDLSIEYKTPTLLPDKGCDYADGQIISIYRPLNQFGEDYDDYDVLIKNVNFYNIVGHQGVLCNGADSVVVTGCKHIKAGLDTDPNNKDYSVFYINSKFFIASSNVVDVSGSIYETHSEFVDIYNNIFINSSTCCLPVGGMNDKLGKPRPAIIKFHDNEIKNTCYVLSPYYYRNTTISLIECYNNSINISSGRHPTRYLFPSTDNADNSIKGNYIPIEKIWIHNERIIQTDTTAVSIWNRIFRTTGITELDIDHCVFVNLSNLPVLAGNNNGEVTLRNLNFSDNTLESCGRNVRYVLPEKREAKLNQAIVCLMMWGRDNFDGSNFSVIIERNSFKEANPYIIVLTKDITNYTGDIDMDVVIRDNDIKSDFPIAINMVNSKATLLKKDVIK